MKSISILSEIQHFLEKNTNDNLDYFPSIWVDSKAKTDLKQVNSRKFILKKIQYILSYKKSFVNYTQSLSKIKNEHHGIGGDWSYFSKIYNVFPRLTTAFNHDQNKTISKKWNAKDLLKETGSFIKLIAILPYIKSLGCNVIYSLPITQIGEDGRKGNLGSPYSVKNHFKIDPNLAEESFPFTVEEQFMAFVEACHILDIRVVLEFVLRTASLDSDWVLKHPEWFYWIDKKELSKFHSPDFSEEEIKQIHEMVVENSGDFLPPSKAYQAKFKAPPKAKQIKKIKGKFIANTDKGDLVIAPAFADWPPDDVQPAWSDVTYLRMYTPEDINEFNYMAYNTIRHYDSNLSQTKFENTSLWNELSNVIPHYQKEFGIDGVMIDMGHALPKSLLHNIINKTRKIDADFGIWEENFAISKHSREIGFNAALGFEFRNITKNVDSLKELIQFATSPLPLPFFGTPETHNTPRFTMRGNIKSSKIFWVVNNFLPSCVPFLHSGYELREENLINTGLNFTKEEIDKINPKSLALFNTQNLNWLSNNNIIPFVQKIGELREKNKNWIATGDERTLRVYNTESNSENVIAFERHDIFQPWKSIVFIYNSNFNEEEYFKLKIEGTYNNSYTEFITDKTYTFKNHSLEAELKPGEIKIFELHKLI